MRKTLKAGNGASNYHHHQPSGASYSQPPQQPAPIQSQHHYHPNDQQPLHHHQHHQSAHHHQQHHQQRQLQHNSTQPSPQQQQINNNNINNNNNNNNNSISGAAVITNNLTTNGPPTKYNHNNNNHHHHHHHQHLSTRSDNESNLNHVLLITVINPHYTVTCDLIHQICSTYGKVNRIVIFRKNGVQAMVEFDDLDSAKRAKSILNGCDIFSGCCTLKIEYAKPTRLNIHRNDNNSYDYTNPDLAVAPLTGSNNQTTPNNVGHQIGAAAAGANDLMNSDMADPSQASGQLDPVFQQDANNQASFSVSRDGQSATPVGSALLGAHNAPLSSQHHSNYAGANDTYSTGSNPQDYQQQQQPHSANNYSRHPSDAHHASNQQHQAPIHHNHHHQQHPAHHHHQQQPHHHNPSHSMPSHHNPHHHYSRSQVSSTSGPLNCPGQLNHGHAGNMVVQNTVMMVYGLQPDRINCDRLFNLFCLYGNVAKVKFLRTKEGCAMVQMGDVLAIDRCVSSLNKMTLFGSELQISYSKQPFLHDVMQPFILPDGSPSFKDFMGNKNNRFKNPEVASKNRISPPSQVLHFFNAPLGTTEDELVYLFKQTAGYEPLSIKIFTPKTENSKSFSGLATFKSPVEASETLVICNHISMPKTGTPHPHILRLCFSPPAYARSHHQLQHSQHHQSSTSSSPPPPPPPLQQQQQQQTQPQQQSSQSPSDQQLQGSVAS